MPMPIVVNFNTLFVSDYRDSAYVAGVAEISSGESGGGVKAFVGSYKHHERVSWHCTGLNVPSRRVTTCTHP